MKQTKKSILPCSCYWNIPVFSTASQVQARRRSSLGWQKDLCSWPSIHREQWKLSKAVHNSLQGTFFVNCSHHISRTENLINFWVFSEVHWWTLHKTSKGTSISWFKHKLNPIFISFLIHFLVLFPWWWWGLVHNKLSARSVTQIGICQCSPFGFPEKFAWLQDHCTSLPDLCF